MTHTVLVTVLVSFSGWDLVCCSCFLCFIMWWNKQSTISYRLFAFALTDWLGLKADANICPPLSLHNCSNNILLTYYQANMWRCEISSRFQLVNFGRVVVSYWYLMYCNNVWCQVILGCETCTDSTHTCIRLFYGVATLIHSFIPESILHCRTTRWHVPWAVIPTDHSSHSSKTLHVVIYMHQFSCGLYCPKGNVLLLVMFCDVRKLCLNKSCPVLDMGSANSLFLISKTIITAVPVLMSVSALIPSASLISCRLVM